MKKSDISSLFERYGPLVYRRALHLLRNPVDAEEATQEVFIRAFNAAESFAHRSRVTTWLVRITTNYCINFIRDRQRRQELWTDHLERQPDSSQTDPTPEGLILFRRILASVDENCAQAAVFVYLDGMTHAEAARLLKVARRTVGKLITRFNKKAEEMLEGRE
jgi:RNA polymerase sigma-70 factor (ECF subfamily)